ncbi:MAG: hypothetical protein ABFQ65_04495, partial [Nanoarchaeota archaeon]
DTIVINRSLTDLDLFVKDFLHIFKRHTDYLIVSGFVGICTGRIRGTEDVDILMEIMEKDRFTKLFNDLIKNGFWCYQGDDVEEIYDYIKNMQNIRFARINEVFPNMKIVVIDKSKKTQFYELNHPQKIKVQNFEFKIPPIEFEILYKEIILGSDKDIADARHLRVFFSEFLSEKKFEEYKKIIKRK